jgi:hypothetical protein
MCLCYAELLSESLHMTMSWLSSSFTKYAFIFLEGLNGVCVCVCTYDQNVQNLFPYRIFKYIMLQPNKKIKIKIKSNIVIFSNL